MALARSCSPSAAVITSRDRRIQLFHRRRVFRVARHAMMPLRDVLHEADAFALHGVGDDRERLAFPCAGRARREDMAELLKGMAIDAGAHVPPERAKLFVQGLIRADIARPPG